MKNRINHTGALQVIERLDNSSNGNPRYRAEVGGLEFVTATDSMLGYSITNLEGKAVAITVGSHYGRITLDTMIAI
tara:strand:+ start:220 stop:447 length:228 start_codon:yes stop_codon:yes gene_type:complete